MASWPTPSTYVDPLRVLVQEVTRGAGMTGRSGDGPPTGCVKALRRGRRQREGQGLRVRARAKRVRAVDELRHADGHGVVGDRCGPRGLRERDGERLRQSEGA